MHDGPHVDAAANTGAKLGPRTGPAPGHRLQRLQSLYNEA
jgi:hypothetical protein